MSIDIVQIGANVGKSFSDMVWALFEETPHLSALFIEPVESSFIKLKEYYSQYENCFFEQLAILPECECKEGTTTLYYYLDPPIYNPNEQAHAGPWNHAAVRVGGTSSSIACLSLEALLQKYSLIGVKFDLLQLDIEGKDTDVILSTDFTNILPTHIRAETTHGGPNSINSHLKNFGFKKIDDPYYNTYERYHKQAWPDSRPEGRTFNTTWERES